MTPRPRRARALLAALLAPALALGGNALAQTPGGTQISNQASAQIGSQSAPVRSGQVISTVALVCQPVLSPESIVTDPVQSLVTTVVNTAEVPFRITNAGNGTFTFSLDTRVDIASSWAPASVRFFLDVNGTGEIDPGDPEVVEVEIAAQASAALVLQIVPPAGANGNLWITPRVACPELIQAGSLRPQSVSGVAELSFSQNRVLSDTDPVVNTSVSIATSSTQPEDPDVRRIEVTVSAVNTGGNAVSDSDGDAAIVTLPLEGATECLDFISASSGAGEVEVQMGTTWMNAALVTAQIQSGVRPTDRARAVRLRLAALVGGEVAELLAQFDLRERDCPNRLPGLQSSANVPAAGYTTKNIGYAEVVPRRAASITFAPPPASTQRVNLSSASAVNPARDVRLTVGEETCFRANVANGGSDFESLRLLLNSSLSGGQRSSMQLSLQNSIGLPIDSLIGLEPGESIEVLICATPLARVNPFDIIAQLSSPSAGTLSNARLRIASIVEADALGLRLEANPHGWVRAGELINFVATASNEFEFQINGVEVTLAIASVVGPDGAEIADAFTITELGAGVVYDAEADVLRWEAGNLEPGFERSVEFQIRLADTLPIGSRLLTLMSATTQGVSQQYFARPLEFMVWPGGATLDVEVLTPNPRPGGLAELRVRAHNPSEYTLDVALEVGGEGLIGEPAVTRQQGGATSSELTAQLPAGTSATWLVSLRVHPATFGSLQGRVVMNVDSAVPQLRDTLQRDFLLNLRSGVLEREHGILIGHIFVDHSATGSFDPARDEAVAGAQVRLADGRVATTDEQGRFAFRDLPIGPWRVQLDAATLPAPLAEGPQRISDHAARVVVGGGLNRLDLPLAPNTDSAGVADRDADRGAAQPRSTWLAEGSVGFEGLLGSAPSVTLGVRASAELIGEASRLEVLFGRSGRTDAEGDWRFAVADAPRPRTPFSALGVSGVGGWPLRSNDGFAFRYQLDRLTLAYLAAPIAIPAVDTSFFADAARASVRFAEGAALEVAIGTVAPSRVVESIEPDGTRSYPLRALPTPGSERVVQITRDASGEVLDEQQLHRGLDYSIDPITPALVLHRPIWSSSVGGDVVTLEMSYATPNAPRSEVVGGVGVALEAGDWQVEAGFARLPLTGTTGFGQRTALSVTHRDGAALSVEEQRPDGGAQRLTWSVSTPSAELLGATARASVRGSSGAQGRIDASANLRWSELGGELSANLGLPREGGVELRLRGAARLSEQFGVRAGASSTREGFALSLGADASLGGVALSIHHDQPFHSAASSSTALRATTQVAGAELSAELRQRGTNESFASFGVRGEVAGSSLSASLAAPLDGSAPSRLQFGVQTPWQLTDELTLQADAGLEGNLLAGDVGVAGSLDARYRSGDFSAQASIDLGWRDDWKLLLAANAGGRFGDEVQQQLDVDVRWSVTPDQRFLANAAYALHFGRFSLLAEQSATLQTPAGSSTLQREFEGRAVGYWQLEGPMRLRPAVGYHFESRDPASLVVQAGLGAVVDVFPRFGVGGVVYQTWQPELRLSATAFGAEASYLINDNLTLVGGYTSGIGATLLPSGTPGWHLRFDLNVGSR